LHLYLDIFLQATIADLKISIADIPEKGLTLQFSKSEDWLREMLSEKGKAGFSTDRIDVQCSVTKTGETVSVEGNITTGINLECCRCLESFTLPVKTVYEYTFLPVENMPEDEKVELTGEDLGLGYYRNDMIDLDPIILEQVVIQVPIKPLCNESCKGLCPVCGINLNVTGCDHKQTAFMNPFAALEKLKTHNKEN
jgi:uncharacterized protein